MKKFFAYEGKYYKVMNRIGNLIGISVLFIITSLPIITLVPSLSALYYTTVKTQRIGNGYPAKEYWKAWKRELKQGILLNILFLVTGIILLIDMLYVFQSGTVFGAISFAVLSFLVYIWLALLIYVPILLSRFSLSSFEVFKLALSMQFRHLPFTILFIGCYLIAAFVLYLMPIPTILLLPALVMYSLSFLIEKILKKYLSPEALSDEQKWYTAL
ncbi:YesL family protein [Jeotgalibaca caeni]|uniref:YesL family protein n=1 Tax=Jeotgalibaca caeni TaxID=3028623 RepID=UPI00237D56E9|nr:YesL family protein [Jeotgalibaca caeni]MDE1549968.1 YesL family protein [Jeotgalibaca caeni]